MCDVISGCACFVCIAIEILSYFTHFHYCNLSIYDKNVTTRNKLFVVSNCLFSWYDVITFKK